MSEYHDRLREHEKRQAEFDAEYRRTHGPPEDRWKKQAEGPPENKMLDQHVVTPENKAEPVDLSALSKAELKALAARRGVDVTRGDGRTDLEPTVSDYHRALG